MMTFKIAEYDEFRSKMGEVQDMCNFIPDVSTDDGYKKSKRVALDVGKLLSALEAKRKEKKAYFLAGGKEVDTQAKAIVSEVESYMLPHKEAYKELDNLRKEREKQRKQGLEDRVEHLRSLPEMMVDSSADEVKCALESIQGEECLDFYEFTEHALKARNSSKTKLAEMFESKLKFEREQEELARLRKESEERARIDREEQIRREASSKAEAEKQQAVQLQLAAERAKVDAERRAIEAEKQAKVNAEIAAENARAAEVERSNAELAKVQAEAEAREANTKHVSSIRKQAKDSIMLLGVDEATAKKIVLAINAGKIENVSIKY
jgi:hypothetical protein